MCVDGIRSRSKRFDCGSSMLCIIYRMKSNEIVVLCINVLLQGSMWFDLIYKSYPFSYHIDAHRNSTHFDTLRPAQMNFWLGLRTCETRFHSFIFYPVRSMWLMSSKYERTRQFPFKWVYSRLEGQAKPYQRHFAGAHGGGRTVPDNESRQFM